MYPRALAKCAWPILTPNLLLFVSGARWQAISAYNNYFEQLFSAAVGHSAQQNLQLRWTAAPKWQAAGVSSSSSYYISRN
jgi:hypothetical protein